MKVRILAAAEQEIVEAAYHYERLSEGLGADFLAEAVRVTRVLTRWHQIGAKLDPTYRRVSLHRFPYGVIYRCKGDLVEVVAIAHRRRRLRYWYYRVQDRLATYATHLFSSSSPSTSS
jgi:plasmid stabilization system protein ParE